ncbi:MAG TPA: CPBP family intramembrane glutamic endopeptidase [Jatrophihabitantaceae bacterium]|nr:CPBP family intramembrane glutamic endopeptidase [Jatrophihabitantaceae bacterium]
MTTGPVAPQEARRDRLHLEVFAVLGVSFGISALGAFLSLLRDELTTPGGIGAQTKCIECPPVTVHRWLDLADQLVGILSGIVPPLLALLLLARVPGGPGFGVGFDLRQKARDAAQGIGFTALIGIPGLALVYVANQLNINATLEAVSYPDYWYRIPYLLLSAFQNGFAEEIVVTAYLLTRLRQLGWTNERALLAESTLRGSYHLYQGYGGFAGNFVMGLIFGWWFQRTRRVVPLVIAHFLLDAFSFIGYVYLHGRIDWI